MSKFFYLLYLLVVLNNIRCLTASLEELKHLPTKCESCQIFSKEFENLATKLPHKMVRILKFQNY